MNGKQGTGKESEHDEVDFTELDKTTFDFTPDNIKKWKKYKDDEIDTKTPDDKDAKIKVGVRLTALETCYKYLTGKTGSVRGKIGKPDVKNLSEEQRNLIIKCFTIQNKLEEYITPNKDVKDIKSIEEFKNKL